MRSRFWVVALPFSRNMPRKVIVVIHCIIMSRRLCILGAIDGNITLKGFALEHDCVNCSDNVHFETFYFESDLKTFFK